MKEVLRTCVACRTKKDQRCMTRVVRRPDGEVVIDATHKENGRGAYVCKTASCVARALKSHALDRQLKTQVPADIYTNLKVSE